MIDNVIGRERLGQLLGIMQAMDLPNSGDGAAFTALGTRAMKMFNTEVIDREDIKYYSWGASFEAGLFDTFRWPWSVIYAKEGPNDGMVSVSSAKWGEYRGTLLGVNHLDLVGWVNQMRYMMSSLTGNPIPFKPATFYLEMVSCFAYLKLTASRTTWPSRASKATSCLHYWHLDACRLPTPTRTLDPIPIRPYQCSRSPGRSSRTPNRRSTASASTPGSQTGQCSPYCTLRCSRTPARPVPRILPNGPLRLLWPARGV